MVAGISTGSQVGMISMTALRYAQPAAGQPVMPVRPAELVYANFRHIQVRPDSRLDSGVPIYKLKILDTLIDHLSPGRAAGREGSARAGAARVDAASIDSLIVEMSRGLRGAEHGRPGGYLAGFLPPPGAFVDLVA
jgi:hypothetical protein